MTDGMETALTRIADALDAMRGGRSAEPDLCAHPAYGWDGTDLHAFAAIDAPPLALLRGIDRQRATVAENVARHAAGADAHDMLLWGARGTGKSALIRAAVVAARETRDIALVQAASDALSTLPELFRLLARVPRPFLLFVDDIGFSDAESGEARILRSLLEGGVHPRPGNVRLAVTTNRRAILSRSAAEQSDPLNPRDAVDDTLALADRFGIAVGFHRCGQDEFLAIVAGYADHFRLEWERDEALEWARRRGALSGRVARQFITELAGRAGRRLD